MGGIAPTEIGTGTDADDAHLAHVPLHGFAIDDQLVVAGQDNLDAARPIRWMRGINDINRVLDAHLLGCRRHGLIVQAAPAETEQVGLVGDRDVTRLAVHQLHPLRSCQGQDQIFF